LKTFSLLLLLNLLLVFPARGLDQTYWVWQRTTPLYPKEAHDLHEAGITQLYWHVGTLKWNGSVWQWREHLQLNWPALHASCPGVAIVPVVRLEAGSAETFPAPSRAPLIQLLNQIVTTSGANALQIDYESPDRLIGGYVDFLRELKDGGRTWRLSISALGHWSKFTGILAGVTDEITPMFYDLNPASERLGKEGLPPLIEPDMAGILANWRGCPISWRAGLPNFSRVTVIAADGHNRGNLRAWSWDDIFFASFLNSMGATANGQTLFTVNRDALLGYTPLKAQERLDVRYPDRDQLRQAETESIAAGAKGIIYFRMADSSDPSGYSVRDLGNTKNDAPSFTVTKDDSGRIILTNNSPDDLLPIIRGVEQSDRGYALELEAQTPIWREAIPGDFARVTSGDAQTGGVGLGISHLQFWFAHLAAGNSLATGYIGQAGSGKISPIRWRIRNLGKEDAWHPLN